MGNSTDALGPNVSNQLGPADATKGHSEHEHRREWAPKHRAEFPRQGKTRQDHQNHQDQTRPDNQDKSKTTQDKLG